MLKIWHPHTAKSSLEMRQPQPQQFKLPTALHCANRMPQMPYPSFRRGNSYKFRVPRSWNSILAWQVYLGSVLRNTAWPYPGTTLPLFRVDHTNSVTSSLLGFPPSWCETKQASVALRMRRHDTESSQRWLHLLMQQVKAPACVML